MHIDLAGKRVLITAAGAGIGRRTAELFGNAGARVYFCDIDADAVADTRDKLADAEGMVADVTDPAAIEALFEAADRHLGGLDIMVNNAGIAGPTAPVEEIALADWEQCLTVNLTATFLCTRLALPRIKAAGGGSVVNLSSAAGKFGFPLRAPYVSAKWAIVGFTRTVALEAGRFGVRCNCIQPGPVEGDRINRVIRAKAAAEGTSENETRDKVASITSLKTFVTATDIANMILFLCSDAGRHITGQNLSVDAGLEGLG